MLDPTVAVTDGKTDGISPKTVAAAVAPFVAGLVVMCLDLAGVIDVDDGLWLGLLGISPVAGGAAYKANTGTVRSKP